MCVCVCGECFCKRMCEYQRKCVFIWCVSVFVCVNKRVRKNNMYVYGVGVREKVCVCVCVCIVLWEKKSLIHEVIAKLCITPIKISSDNTSIVLKKLFLLVIINEPK